MKYGYTVISGGSDHDSSFVKRPIVEVEIFGPKGSIRELALVDSGADRSLFNMEIAEYLGLDLSKARDWKVLGISGGPLPQKITTVEMQIKHLEKKFLSEVGFVTGLNTVALLGQKNFFELHRIKFEKDHDTFELIPKY